MLTIPDSNVILDLLLDNKNWGAWSDRQFARCRSEGELVMTPVVFSEISPEFRTFDQAHSMIDSLGFAREDIPYSAAYLAGQTHAAYRKRGGERARTLPDFLVGAHAAVQGYRILTRDASRYRGYFPNVEVIAPDTHP
jgi:predicted nucleic acid-binding protein